MPNCNTAIAGVATHNNASFGPHQLNSNDSRFGQVVYANGKLWGALGTAITVGSEERAGVGYYVVNPATAKLVLQGQAGEGSTDMTYPTVGVTDSGRGVIVVHAHRRQRLPERRLRTARRTWSDWVMCMSRKRAPGRGTASRPTSSSEPAVRAGAITARRRS